MACATVCHRDVTLAVRIAIDGNLKDIAYMQVISTIVNSPILSRVTL